tara:strand:- start:4907 stop:5479 length:573 start_codon:yes stop_codon:yes gene_type:complete
VEARDVAAAAGCCEGSTVEITPRERILTSTTGARQESRTTSRERCIDVEAVARRRLDVMRVCSAGSEVNAAEAPRVLQFNKAGASANRLDGIRNKSLLPNVELYSASGDKLLRDTRRACIGRPLELAYRAHCLTVRRFVVAGAAGKAGQLNPKAVVQCIANVTIVVAVEIFGSRVYFEVDQVDVDTGRGQ